MSPKETGAEDVKLDVSDPETFSVPSSTTLPSVVEEKSPGLLPNTTTVTGATESPISKMAFGEFIISFGARINFVYIIGNL